MTTQTCSIYRATYPSPGREGALLEDYAITVLGDTIISLIGMTFYPDGNGITFMFETPDNGAEVDGDIEMNAIDN